MVVGVVPFGLWKYIRTKVVGFGKGLEAVKYQLLRSKKVQVDLKGSKTAGVNDPSPSQ